MKYLLNNIYLILSGIALLLCSASCNIEPSDRFVEMPQVDVRKTALLMDFTGQQCVNCPEAHEVMEELMKQYGDTALVTVSIHGGALATPINFTNFERNNIGLMTQEGNQINDAFGITSWPMGVVDRYNASGAAMNSGEWAAAVRSALESPTDVRIKAEAEIRDSVIYINTEFISDVEMNAALQVWVVEDSIVTRQQTMQGRIDNYVHNNVFRGTAYSVRDGKKLSLQKSVWEKDSVQIPTRWTNSERWVHKNLSIIAFVYRDTYVLNTVRVPVKIEE